VDSKGPRHKSGFGLIRATSAATRRLAGTCGERVDNNGIRRLRWSTQWSLSCHPYLYIEIDAYKRSELRDTLNSNDGIALEGGDRLHGSVRENVDRYIVSLGVTVDPNAQPISRCRRPRRQPDAAPMTEDARRAALVPQRRRATP